MVTLRAEGWGDSLGPPTSCPPWAFASPVFLHYIFNVSLMERDGVYVYTMISTLGNYCSGLSHAHQATPKHGGLKQHGTHWLTLLSLAQGSAGTAPFPLGITWGSLKAPPPACLHSTLASGWGLGPEEQHLAGDLSVRTDLGFLSMVQD